MTLWTAKKLSWYEQLVPGSLTDFAGGFDVVHFFQAILIMGISWVVGASLGGLSARAVAPWGSPAWGLLARRLVAWTFLGIGFAASLRVLGIDPSVLLGAAGMVTVAAGFAAQTSASNLISGLFLMMERTITVGDVLQLDPTTSGEVLAVGLLSVKLRTFDNRLIRVPNETLVKTTLVNLSQFPIRRVDLNLKFPAESDLHHVRTLLLQIAELEPEALQEPGPQFMLTGFDQGCVDVLFTFWVARDGLVHTRSRVVLEVGRVLRENGILLGAPRRDLVIRA
jgi:small conductance mechanosensitive channel